MVKQDNKDTAKQFLQLVVSGKADETYETFVDPKAKHHNPYFKAGFEVLVEGLREAHKKTPDEKITTKHVIGEGDLVVVHSHLEPEPGKPGMATFHLFRFKDGKIIEFWDCGWNIPKDSPNKDGAF